MHNIPNFFDKTLSRLYNAHTCNVGCLITELLPFFFVTDIYFALLNICDVVFEYISYSENTKQG